MPTLNQIRDVLLLYNLKQVSEQFYRCRNITADFGDSYVIIEIKYKFDEYIAWFSYKDKDMIQKLDKYLKKMLDK